MTPCSISSLINFSVASAPHRDTHLAQEGLRSCYADTGNVYECLIVS